MGLAAVASRVRSNTVRLPTVAAVALTVLGVLVLYGWQVRSPWLTSVVPGLVAMAPSTALGMVLLGLGLGCAESRTRAATVVVNAAAVAILIISLTTLLGYAGMGDRTLERLLDVYLTGGFASSARMAAATALSFTLSTAALLLLQKTSAAAIFAGQICALIMLALVLASLFGYLFRAELPTKLAIYSTMALHTTIGFLLAGGGLLGLRPGDGVMRDVTAPQLGGRVFRAVSLAIMLLPPAFASVVLLFGHIGWYGHEFALAIYAAFQIAVLGAATWSAARWLNKTDRRRWHAELDNERLIDELRQVGTELEDKVAKRTRELAESEAKFRSLLDLTSDWYWEQDQSLRFTYVSSPTMRSSAGPWMAPS